MLQLRTHRVAIGLTVVLVWVLIVIAVFILTRKIAAFGLLGLAPVLVFPFRKRS